MKLKDGVVLAGLRPEVKAVLPAIEKVFQSLDLELVVTSTTDDNPPRGNPAHRQGRAVDLRAHQVNPFLLPLLRRNMEQVLGSKWSIKAVLYWPQTTQTHIHAEIKS